MTMEANGVYTFELHETLDHYDPTTADEDITLTFGLDVYDSAGDKTETSLRIRIKDDGNETETTDTLPSQGDGSQEAGGYSNANIYLKNDWDIHSTPELNEKLSLTNAWFSYDPKEPVQNDNAVSVKDSFESAQTIMNIEGNGVFQVAEFNDNNILTHNGEEISVVFDPTTNIYFGTADEKIIFNIKIEDNGDYHFNLFDSVDQSLNGDGHETITLQFGIVGENENGDETQDYVNIDIKGMGSQFAQASSESIDITSFLEGTDEIAESIDAYIVETELASSIKELSEHYIGAFNDTAAFGETTHQQQTEII
jgi:hypothetical protein